MTATWVDQALQRLADSNPWYRPAEHAPTSLFRGLNVSGYFRDESGWGAAARGYVRALESLGVPIALYDLSGLSSNRAEDRTLTEFRDDRPYDANLVCVDASQHFSVITEEGLEFFDARCNIGAWAWELPSFPERWLDRFAYYDEVWVATSFIANAISPVSPVPVVRIPPVLTPSAVGSRDRGRALLGARDDELVYLFVFDFHSHVRRKNPLGVVSAFRRAFLPSEPVRLVIKCVNEGSDPRAFGELMRASESYPVDVRAGYWPAKTVRDVMTACDVYVSLHRSEGTGLTITDAMALGKPVIATGWSGNMDFMTVANSFPVRYELIELEKAVGPYPRGELWADPSVEHAAELMRLVFENRDEAHAHGARARADIEAAYSEKAVAELIGKRLEVVAGRDALPTFRRDMRAFYLAYRELVSTVRRIVRDVAPAGSTVLVVSRGEPGLVQIEGRRGWHFPQTNGGVYAGHYPADSDAAIEHLDALRKKGAEFLVLPGTAFWWLEHYEGFRAHLDRECLPVWSDDRCVIYKLSRTSPL